MKIAFLINEMNICGGTHKQFLKLLDFADRQGLDFFIATRIVDYEKTYPGFAKYKDKVRLFPYPNKWILRTRNRKLIQYFIKRRFKKIMADADIVNVHDCGMGNLFYLLKGKKVYWQVNDLPSCFAFGAHKNRKVTAEDLKRQEESRQSAKYVTEFSVNVSKNAERIQEAYGRPAHVFYCGIEPVCIERDVEQSLERFKKKEIHILSSGVFYPYRNYETQVEVVKLLVAKGIRVHLDIIGAHPNKEYADKIKAMIAQNKLFDFITLHGQVDDATFKQLHQQADIFMFINVDQSWGLAVFEAMSCAMPVIVSNSVGATEILADNDNSVFVDPLNSVEIANRIVALMDDENYYRNICESASKFHLNWSWDEAYCSKMIDLMLK